MTPYTKHMTPTPLKSKVAASWYQITGMRLKGRVHVQEVTGPDMHWLGGRVPHGCDPWGVRTPYGTFTFEVYGNLVGFNEYDAIKQLAH